MKCFSAALLLLALLVSGVSSANDDARVEAEKLLDVLQMEDALDQTIQSLLDVQLSQKPEMLPYKDVMMKFFRKYMSYASLKPGLVELYVDEFTESELRDIREFYATPTGRKTVEKLPVLASKGAQLGAQLVQENIKELQQMIAEESERIEAAQKPPSD